MAANTKGSCKVCKHTKRAGIERKMVNGDSLSSIAKYYGINWKTIKKHKEQHMAASMFKDIEEVKSSLDLEVIKERLNDQMEKIDKLIAAVDYWLQDPEDPSKYFIGARSEEIECVYNDIDEESGRRMATKRKAPLQLLLDRLSDSGRFALMDITMKMSDPRDLLLKCIKDQQQTVALVNQMFRQQIEWIKKKELMDKALEKANDDDSTITIEKEIQMIAEKITVAKQGNEKLCEIVGLD